MCFIIINLLNITKKKCNILQPIVISNYIGNFNSYLIFNL